MKFFIDTADFNEIRDLAATGLVDGVTTNPSLIAKSGRQVPGPDPADLRGGEGAGLRRGRRDRLRHHAGRGPQAVQDREEHRGQGAADAAPGSRSAARLSDAGTMVNVTLCFSAGQALLAAKAGATFISPFVGRLDDVGEDGMALIADIVQIYRNYPHLKTEVLVASIRGPRHVIEAAKMGAHVGTLPPAALRSAVQPSADRQGPGRLRRRLGEDRPEHPRRARARRRQEDGVRAARWHRK